MVPSISAHTLRSSKASSIEPGCWPPSSHFPDSAKLPFLLTHVQHTLGGSHLAHSSFRRKPSLGTPPLPSPSSLGPGGSRCAAAAGSAPSRPLRRPVSLSDVSDPARAGRSGADGVGGNKPWSDPSGNYGQL